MSRYESDTSVARLSVRGLSSRIPRALRHRDFAFLWAGQSISMVGDGIFNVALALQTIHLKPRPSSLAVVLAARLIPTVVLLLVGGVVVDRVSRRLTMLASDCIRAIAVSVIAGLSATGTLKLGELIAMAAVFGTADAFSNPAQNAVVPELLPTDLLVEASALQITSYTVSVATIGPALGGFVVTTIGLGAGFAIDGASFFLSAASLLMMRSNPKPRALVRRTSFLRETWEGLRYCASQRWLWVLLIATAVINFASTSPANP